VQYSLTPFVKTYNILQLIQISGLSGLWHCIYMISVSNQTTMKANTTKTNELLKAIDKQLKAIIEKDILKIDDLNIRNAAFLQLIAA